MIANAQVISFGFYIGIHNLVVEKLSADRFPFNAPEVVIHQSAEETEAVVSLQRIDWQEICKLPNKAGRPLFEIQQIQVELLEEISRHGK